MANGIDMAMNATAEPGAPHKQHVHTVQLVRAYDFYGYHAEQQLFMKIIMYERSPCMNCFRSCQRHDSYEKEIHKIWLLRVKFA